jgi:type VI secretion system protein ImpL
MDALLLILRMPWLQSLAGVAALTMLIWYLGPLLSLAGNTPLASERGRIIATVVVIALWAVYQAIKWLLAKRKNKNLADQLSTGQTDTAEIRSGSELKQIQDSFDGAMKFLRKARLGKGRKLLYQLPWYMIIGPPGAGKTTALLNCGLNFPLQKKKIRGVGGTRNCDWWFTDEAVLIDTAGRWATQDSDEAVDSQVWQGFLGLLKKYRKRQPINGVFIAISLRDLMLQDENERTEVAQALKQRIK